MDNLDVLANFGDGYFIIIDKPPNHTSSETTAIIKKLFGLSRAGHAGTLDPNVTGVLPIALGKATKLVDYISKQTKVYVGIAKFNSHLDKYQIIDLFSKFTGDIIQTPPKMSAVKKSPRKRHIYYIKLLEFQYDRHDKTIVLFETKVQAGTYIRTLCVDMGKQVNGGKMVELRRTNVGSINESESHTLHDVARAIYYFTQKGNDKYLKAMLVKPESIIDLTSVPIKKTALKSVCSGALISRPGLLDINALPDNLKRGDLVKIFCCDTFIGIARALMDKDKMLSKKKAVCFKMERVHNCNIS